MNPKDSDMNYPIGIQTFSDIITDDYAYVDKTEMVYRIANSGKCYFISRPRRFGKSLLLSTFESYFKGRRDLFEGLAISAMEKEWTEYPVLRLDLNSKNYTEADALTAELNKHLEQWETLYGNEFSNRSTEERFYHVIANAYNKTGQKVVILIDEYDKPLLQTSDIPELQEKNRATLKAFYGNLKTCDNYIRFAFITGVTKFSKISIFSDLNNLDDITFSNVYSTLCGITEEELHSYFDEGIGELAATEGVCKEECYRKLKEYYDGYLFSVGGEHVYNPFSVLKTLKQMQFGEYWYETATPEFLVKRLQDTEYDLERITNEETTAGDLSSLNFSDPNPLPLLYQSGYLTIKGHDSEFGTFTLGFPNREVERGFTRLLSNHYIPREKGSATFALSSFVREIRSGNTESFMTRMAAMFADGNYQVIGDCEIYFQNTMYVFFKMLGFHVEVERHTSRGRIDAVMQTKDYVYIIEIKTDQSADIALRQIEEKGYATPFATDPRKLIRIGINFNTRHRCIDDWKVV